jgi:hypothetical protein
LVALADDRHQIPSPVSSDGSCVLLPICFAGDLIDRGSEIISMLSVSLALAQLRNDEFEVAWLADNAHCNSMFEMIVQ